MSVSIDGMRDLTFDEFVELPEELHKGAELIDGVVHVSTPNWRHQDAVANILEALRGCVRAGDGRGKATHDPLVRINDRNAYKPDVAWYKPDDSPTGSQRSFLGPPTIVIEVLSPSTRLTDLMRKPMGYSTIGVQEFWIVDVDDASVLLLRRSGDRPGLDTHVELPPDGAITSPLLPGFSLPVADVFAE